MKAKRVNNPDGSLYGVRFECPGCNDPHIVPVKPHERGWDFNGDFERPTLGPSILVHPHGALAEDGSVYQTPTCHSFVRDGRIEYCGDSTHALAGKTVELPTIEEEVSGA